MISPANFNYILDPGYSVNAWATSGLPLSYSSSNTSVATVNATTGEVTIVGAGSTTITVSQAGDNNFEAAANVEQTLNVAKADQSIAFAITFSKYFGDAPFDLNLFANASSGLSLTYTSSDPSVASIDGSTVTIHKAGMVTITASQGGTPTTMQRPVLASF